jgi:hypothetical protein
LRALVVEGQAGGGGFVVPDANVSVDTRNKKSKLDDRSCLCFAPVRVESQMLSKLKQIERTKKMRTITSLAPVDAGLLCTIRNGAIDDFTHPGVGDHPLRRAERV